MNNKSPHRNSIPMGFYLLKIAIKSKSNIYNSVKKKYLKMVVKYRAYE